MPTVGMTESGDSIKRKMFVITVIIGLIVSLLYQSSVSDLSWSGRSIGNENAEFMYTLARSQIF